MVLAVTVTLTYSPFARTDNCNYSLVSIDIIWLGGYSFYFVPNYELFCSIDVSGGGVFGGNGGGGPGGGPIDPGGGGYQQQPPTIQLTAVNDQNPKNYAVHLSLTNTDTLSVFINGSLFNTYSGSTTSVLLGSLGNLPSGSNEIGFLAENSIATITRTFTALRVPQNYYAGNTVNVGYQVIPGDPLSQNSDIYNRILTVNALYTSYSLATEGPRNGRVEHETVTDEMNLVTTTWPSSPSQLIWTSTYGMTDVDLSDAIQLGVCGNFSHCGAIGKFAIEGYPNGSARMGAVTSTAAGGVPGIAIPINLDIGLDP